MNRLRLEFLAVTFSAGIFGRFLGRPQKTRFLPEIEIF
jgi:hypothetical protein